MSETLRVAPYRGEGVACWIEKYCRTPTSYRLLTPEQRAEISRLYDEPSSPELPALDHLDTELAACLRLGRLCGPLYVRGSTIAAAPPPGAFLVALGIARRSPKLWQVLRLENGRLRCPELDTSLTE